VQELDALFTRARAQPDLEVQSDYARFLVIRICGLVEQVITEIVLAYSQSHAHPAIVSHVDWRMNGFQNPKFDRILRLAESFQPAWKSVLKANVTIEEREALGSIVDQRNSIAHGQQSTMSLGQVGQYYAQIKLLLDKIAWVFV
jgi:hypothetical protein